MWQEEIRQAKHRAGGEEAAEEEPLGKRGGQGKDD